MIYMDELVTATRNGTSTEDLRPFCLDAYEKSLKRYHGWMVQQVFSVNNTLKNASLI